MFRPATHCCSSTVPVPFTDQQDAAVVSQEVADLLQKWAIHMIEPLQLEERFYSRHLLQHRRDCLSSCVSYAVLSSDSDSDSELSSSSQEDKTSSIGSRSALGGKQREDSVSSGGVAGTPTSLTSKMQVSLPSTHTLSGSRSSLVSEYSGVLSTVDSYPGEACVDEYDSDHSRNSQELSLCGRVCSLTSELSL
ncbi:UNVERIFIED_CONTAM: hypothetical protein FKN15_010708 [Acipenser sinensis]